MTIVEFEEKPAEPKSTKASMGIYIFNWQRLRTMLVDAEKNNVDMSDFGSDINWPILNRVNVFILTTTRLLEKM